MLMLPAEILAFFPHDRVREGQDQLLLDVNQACMEKKILIAHAPTGLGKTASALAIAAKEALEKNKKVFFLTNRHTQHHIAVSTLQLIREKAKKEITVVDLIGKQWMCHQNVGRLSGSNFTEYCKTVVERGECEYYNAVWKKKEMLTPEARLLLGELQKRGPLHNEGLIAVSAERQMCSYEISLELAKKATVIIGDYYYLFNPHVRQALLSKIQKGLQDIILIVDEAHNLPGRVTDMLSTQLSTSILQNSIREAKKFSCDHLVPKLQHLQQALATLAIFPQENKAFGKLSPYEKEQERLVTKEEFLAAVKKGVEYEEFSNELEMAAEDIRTKQQRSYLGGIAAFLESWQGSETGFARIISQQGSLPEPQRLLRYNCLDPALVTREIFSGVHAAVLMSGTLQPTFMYKDILGIETSHCLEKVYASPFPPENKLSLIVPETSTKYELRGTAMYKSIADKSSSLLRHIPGNVALFFPSYALRDAIGQFIQTERKVFWEKPDMTKEEKENFLEQFKAGKQHGGILLGVIGANFAEGVDFPGDILNGVLVIGLPLARPDLQTKESIRYYDERFGKGWDYGYLYPAMAKCIQSAGRCIRSETDRGVTIYLDERFAWQRYYTCLPREGLIVTKQGEELLHKFFKK